MPERITEARLRQIYGETIDVLYGYASRRCGGQRELAEDVTQEVWLRAVRDWRRISCCSYFNRSTAWDRSAARKKAPASAW